MGKTMLYLLVFAAFVACRNNKPKIIEKTAPKTESKSIEYETNRNIITFRIAYNLIKENRQWATRPNPVRDNLLSSFEEFENHEVLDLIKQYGGDNAISLYLLHKKEFPEFGDKYTISKKNKEYELNDSTQTGLNPKWNLLYKSLHDFYLKANVDEFIEEHLYYYEGAIQEISTIARDFDLVGKMEEYTNQINDRYVISPEPLFITGGWRGIGPSIKTDEISIAYQFISPSDRIDLTDFSRDSVKQFGYNDKDFIRNLCVHEFGHSFVNASFYNQEISEFIQNHEFLITEEIKETMQREGIGNLTGYLVEHVVRLLEIRIASIYFGNENAQKIRDENKGFIYLEKMENELIERFEKNRDKYPTYADFIPELIKVVEK
ncbi:DUF4932 domain-containing protein [Zobellia nedashkovskayae]|uniref:DUF4932 domain-containing protein n=1 Tax=Zobellia nedashkovskayae TaxID=2779510 RepID=UPI00188BCE87|nr:DUF4932 domain-containing protein [Zobellia nedashkovskayae]